MVKTFNNKTEYIKFDKNEMVHSDAKNVGRTTAYDEVEMAEK